MYILITWGLTIILSYGMNLCNGLRLFKDCANLGYKIDINKLNNLLKENNSIVSKNNNFTLFIPIYNMISELLNASYYSNNSEEEINVLKRNRVLVLMTRDEIEKYRKSPSSINAWSISTKSNNSSNEEIKLIVHHKDKEDSIVYYTIDNDMNYRILKTSGPISNLSNEKKLEIVSCSFDAMAMKCGSWTKMIKEMQGSEDVYTIELTEEDIDKVDLHAGIDSFVNEIEDMIMKDTRVSLDEKEKFLKELNDYKEELLLVIQDEPKKKKKIIGRKR